MLHLNLKISDLRRPEVIGAEPVERATWLMLCAYCADQESGGVITGAAKWKDRQWQQTCGVTLAEIQTKSDLWAWEDDDLIINLYPLETEQYAKAKRTAGAAGGRSKSPAKKAAAQAREKQKREQSTSKPQAKHKQSTSKPQHNVRKGNVKKGNVTLNARAREEHEKRVSDEIKKEIVEARPPTDCPCRKIVDSFNEHCGRHMPMVQIPTPDRKEAMKIFWDWMGEDFEKIDAYWQTAARSKFLTGRERGSNFRASFDWLLKQSNAVKVIEGHYK